MNLFDLTVECYGLKRGAIFCFLLLCAGVYSTMATAESLQEYAATCDTEIGATVPSFSCSGGALLPMNGVQGGNCEKPPYLDEAGCYSNSRFSVLHNEGNIRVVALCRHKTRPGGEQFYEDIAVIQTNFDNGATCFYQQFGDDLDGNDIPEPSTGGFWMPPSEIANDDNACVQCHDSGPFIRTPYLTQVNTVKTALAIRKVGGADEQKYWFPGDALTTGAWNGKVFKVKLDNDGSCSGICHLMGANSIDRNSGTSAFFGPRATGAVASENLEEANHHALGYWMNPPRQAPNPEDQDASRALAACASAVDATTVDHCTREVWPRP